MSVNNSKAGVQKQESTTAVPGFDNGSKILPKTAANLTSANRMPSTVENNFAGDIYSTTKEKFEKYFSVISEKVDPKGHILNLLFEKEVITNQEKSIIYNLKDPHSRCIELLNLLTNSKNLNAFSVFKEALGEDHQWLVDAIDSRVDDSMPQDEDTRIDEKVVYSTLALVPMKTIDIMVQIQGFVANVECTLWYSNTSETPMEVVYEFPMDEQSAVYRFEATINGRTIVAECQEKKEAKANYTTAIESGLTATLMEEDDSSSDIFRCSLGHLPSNAQAEVRFAYVTELSLEPEGQLSFVLPTVLNPRYNPSVSDGGRVNPLDISYVSEVLPQPYTIMFKAVIADAKQVTSVTSHKDDLNVVFNDNRNEVKVSLAKQFVADHDLSFDVTYRDTCQPKVIIEKGLPSKGKSLMERSFYRLFMKSEKNNSATNVTDGFLTKDIVMLNFFPDFNHLNFSNVKHEFIFLIDRSGSMAGRRIREAKEGLLLFLNSLPLDCYFNIIGYGSNFQVLFQDGSQQSCDLSLKQAREYVEDMAADLGGTEILAPLRFVFSKAGIISHHRQVILLTDGDVTNSQAVIELITNQASETRVFSIGIGEGASTSLVKGVARAGRGKAAFVKDKENMQPVILSMLESAKQPCVTDIRIQWKSDRPKDLTPVLIPHRIPPLYSSDRLILYAVFPRQTDIKATVTLSGNIGTEVIEYSLLVDFTEAVSSVDSSLPLHRLAAAAEIKHLQTEEKANPMTRNSEVKSSIVSLSIDANIVSRHTSMVAIDRQLNEVVKEVNVFQRRDAVKCKVPLMQSQSSGVKYQSNKYHRPAFENLLDLPGTETFCFESESLCEMQSGWSINASEESGSTEPIPKSLSVNDKAKRRNVTERNNSCDPIYGSWRYVNGYQKETRFGYKRPIINSSTIYCNAEDHGILNEERIFRSRPKYKESNEKNGITSQISNIPLIENLQLTRKQSKDVVSGICTIGDTIYVVCRASNTVCGYEVGSGGSDPEVIEVHGMQLPSDMTSCESNQALFISDTNPDDRCIWKIQFPGKNISKWSVGGTPRGLSMTSSNELMVIVQSEEEGRLEFYSSSSSNCLKKMSLPEEYQDVWHAVQTTTGTYVVAYTENKYNSSEPEDDFFDDREVSKYSLTEISSDGTAIRSFKVDTRLKLYHLSIDKNDIVFVADEKGVLRVDLADEMGGLRRVDLNPKEQTGLMAYEKIRAPVRLSRQSHQQRLIVGWCTKLSSVTIFDIDCGNKSEQSQASSSGTETCTTEQTTQL